MLVENFTHTLKIVHKRYVWCLCPLERLGPRGTPWSKKAWRRGAPCRSSTGAAHKVSVARAAPWSALRRGAPVGARKQVACRLLHSRGLLVNGWERQRGNFFHQAPRDCRPFKSDFFARSVFSLIKFCAELCTKIAIKPVRFKKINIVKMCQKYACFAGSAFKSLNFAQILENFARTCVRVAVRFETQLERYKLKLLDIVEIIEYTHYIKTMCLFLMTADAPRIV